MGNLWGGLGTWVGLEHGEREIDNLWHGLSTWVGFGLRRKDLIIISHGIGTGGLIWFGLRTMNHRHVLPMVQ
jgi:hypothetical protein